MKILFVLFLLFVTFSSAEEDVKPILRKHPELFKVYSLLDELQAGLSKEDKTYGDEYNQLYSNWKHLSELSTKIRIEYGKAKFQMERLKGIIKQTDKEQQKLLTKSEKAQKEAFLAKLEAEKATKLASEALKKFKEFDEKALKDETKTDANLKAIVWLKQFIGKHHGLDCFYGEWKKVKGLLGNVECRTLECCKIYQQEGQWRSFCEKNHKVCK